MGGSGRLGKRSIAAIVGLCVLSIGPGMTARLSYHEAIVAQGVREMRAAGTWLVPLLDSRPWLEKPPLLHWLIKIGAWICGDATELVARVPSLLGAIGISLAVATLASRRFNPIVGLIAGCIQATTSWTVLRGRLAEADILLACLIAWVIVGFDRLRCVDSSKRLTLTRWVLVGIGAAALLKGIVFGAVLIVATLVLILAWDRDWFLLMRLVEPLGLVASLLIALAWPATILSRYPEALKLWTTHVADRLADRPEVFAGQASWWAYAPVALSLTLPWMPFALVGAWRSLRRAWNERGGVDRLLWAWAFAPLVLLSMATVKNPHYAIHALAPWSIWAAPTLVRIGERITARGRSLVRARNWLITSFVVLATAFGLGYGVIAPRLEKRSIEWGFYERVAGQLKFDDSLVLLYDDWDRLPYPTPFGPVPHDLAIRLYYLKHPVAWREGKGSWPDLPETSFLAIGRDRDTAGLSRVGTVERVLQGPPARWDRTYSLYRVTPFGLASATKPETSHIR